MKTVVLAAAFVCAPLVPAILVHAAPDERGPVAVLVNPLRAQAAFAVVAAADGRVVRFGRWPFLAVAESGAEQDDGRFGRG